MRVLVVEDDLQLATYLKKGMEQGDFTVDGVGLLSDAEDAVETVPYDLVVLDLGLPDGDGLDLLRKWRAQGNRVPVLVLTSRDGVNDRIRGLNAGADDYVLKPFAVEEVVARSRALLRRSDGALGLCLEVGNITFDPTGREVTVDGKPIKISRKEMNVLEILMRRAGHVVSKDVLEAKVFGFDDEASHNTLEAQISRLRKRLSAANTTAKIRTLRGVGYMLVDS